MKQLLPLLIITLFTTTLSAQRFNAQNGFIVKSTGDTVCGQIKDQANVRKEVQFQEIEAQEVSIYTPDEIAAFFYEGGY
jgi:hypothetical protein